MSPSYTHPAAKPARHWTAQDDSYRFLPSQRLPNSLGRFHPSITPSTSCGWHGDYYPIQRAINVAPSNGAVISVAPGVYHKVLTITKPNITLRSPYKDAARTVIVADKSAGTSGGTHNSATVDVLADNFIAKNLTIENNSDSTHPGVRMGRQAVALLVRGDRDIFENVRFLGGQDTLYADGKSCHGTGATRACIPARQFFDHCYIQGNVDFIFGDANVVFDLCTINSTPHAEGTITAQSKSHPSQSSGVVFNDCRLTAATGVQNVYLGRPWRPYSTVVYLHTWMGKQIAPAGWIEWHPGKTHRLATAFYAEYDSTGPGANPSQREPYSKQLTA
jgi:pectin methylesterase-like acyl-CoA thioesterase